LIEVRQRDRILAAGAVILVILVALTAVADLMYGTIFPWDVPKRLNLCGLEYRLAKFVDGTQIPASEGTLVLQPTILNLPLIVPSLSASDPSKPYAGCPSLIALRGLAGDSVFLPEAAP
jgi:hypothetical protein